MALMIFFFISGLSLIFFKTLLSLLLEHIVTGFLLGFSVSIFEVLLQIVSGDFFCKGFGFGAIESTENVELVLARLNVELVFAKDFELVLSSITFPDCDFERTVAGDLVSILPDDED